MKIEKRQLVRIGICVLLIAITWMVYGQTLNYDFVNYDDNTYVYANPHVVHGLTFSGVVWPFAHFDFDNWLPLTTISHMIDCQIFGLKPAGHHFINLLLHTVGAILLFLAIDRMTGSLWASAFVAAIFAIHPLHVESVVWVAERKDVLSGVFFMLTLLGYSYYTRRPSIARYLVMFMFFVCGLLSKPMLVTLPIVLVLLDYWPLGRCQRIGPTKLLLEKIPLLAISAGLSVVTLVVLREAMPGVETLSFGSRLSNAAIACVIYIWRMIWPTNLGLAYPYAKTFPVFQTVMATGLLIAVTLLVIAHRRHRPYLLTGWFWYLVMLLPVIGFIQVGVQARADRYTYLPQIGLYISITWMIVDLAAGWRRRRVILGAAAALIIVAFMSVATIQASTWRDSETLWRHALAVSGGENNVAHFYLGEWLVDHNRADEALLEFAAVLRERPENADTHFNIGNALLEKGQLEKAVAEYETALRIDPSQSDAETTLANILFEVGRRDEAFDHYRNVVWLRPTSAAAHYNLGRALYRDHRISEAIVYYEEAIAIDPDYPDAANSLTRALLDNKRKDDDRFSPKKP